MEICAEIPKYLAYCPHKGLLPVDVGEKHPHKEEKPTLICTKARTIMKIACVKIIGTREEYNHILCSDGYFAGIWAFLPAQIGVKSPSGREMCPLICV